MGEWSGFTDTPVPIASRRRVLWCKLAHGWRLRAFADNGVEVKYCPSCRLIRRVSADTPSVAEEG